MKKFVDAVRPPIDPEEVHGFSRFSEMQRIAVSVFLGIVLGIAMYAFIIDLM